MPGFFIGSFIFIFGACIGSFLNVCIVRMPQELSVVKPRSHCMSCKKTVAWYDNIPLLSYIILSGKCRHCGQKFSIRYFFVELLTALIFVGLYRYFGLSGQCAAYMVMVSCFLVAIFTDFEHRIIPDEISVGGMFMGIVLSVIVADLHVLDVKELMIGRMIMRVVVGICFGIHVIEYLWHRHRFEKEDIVLLGVIIGMVLMEWTIDFSLNLVSSGSVVALHLRSLSASLTGALLGGGVIYGMGLVGDFIFGKESMGGGDVKLMALIGAFLGWKLAVLTFFIAPFFGAFYGIAEKIRTKESAIAYGPFIVMGAVVSMFYGDVIIKWVLGQYGVVY